MAQEAGSEEAATSTPVPAPGSTTLLGRVATILGLEETTVEDAFQQARKDQRTEKYREALDRKIEQGFITSEEADEPFLWFHSRPDSLAVVSGKAAAGEQPSVMPNDSVANCSA